MNNKGSFNLVNVRVTEATANNEVKLATELPRMPGITEEAGLSFPWRSYPRNQISL